MLENINGTVDLIDAEEADDSQKLATCNKEQDINNKKRDDKKAKMDELTASISELEISAKSTKKQISETEVQLADNRAGQKESTDARNEANAIFKTNLKNLEDAERIGQRVLGGAHPLAGAIRRSLQNARAALHARETQPSPPARSV